MTTVSAAEGRKLLASLMTEAEFQGWVVTTARMLGWLAFHPYDSRRSEAGFPDTTLVRGERLIFAELKAMKGRVTAAQQSWLDALKGVPGIEVHLWRVDQLDEILEILR